LSQAFKKERTKMKIDAISITERATIIAQLAARGKWKGERMGAHVEFARIKTETGSVVQYAVTIRRHTIVHARATTVADAVTDCNQIIARHVPPQDPTAGRIADPTRPGMGHLERKARRENAASGQGGLW
jgi:hypothetical protein